MAALHESYRLYEPVDPANPLDFEAQKRRDARQASIVAIAHNHSLTDHLPELQQAIANASEAYWTWWISHARSAVGVGSREAMKSLTKALMSAVKHLDDIQVRNRLEYATRSVPSLPIGPESTVEYEFGTSIFKSVGHARATINGLLRVATEAEKIDGRAFSTTRRDDIRAAAEPLLKFLQSSAKRSGKLGQRGGIYYPAVEFLNDCLLLIDEDVTPRLIADLDP